MFRTEAQRDFYYIILRRQFYVSRVKTYPSYDYVLMKINVKQCSWCFLYTLCKQIILVDSRKEFYYTRLPGVGNQAAIIRSCPATFSLMPRIDQAREHRIVRNLPLLTCDGIQDIIVRRVRARRRPHRFMARAASCPTAVSPLSSPIYETRVLTQPWCIYHTERTVSPLCARRTCVRLGNILLALHVATSEAPFRVLRNESRQVLAPPKYFE